MEKNIFLFGKGGKKDLFGTNAQAPGDLLAAFPQEFSGSGACAMEGAGIAEICPCDGTDPVDYLGKWHGRGGIVKVYHKKSPVFL